MANGARNGEVPADVVARLRAICEPLPGAVEEEAWAGTRFRVRGRTFVHCVRIADGHPPAFARHAGTDGPALVLTFESEGDELEALRRSGPPFWTPPWRRSVVGMFLDADPDWDEIAELVIESYCVQAPKKLAAEVRDCMSGGSDGADEPVERSASVGTPTSRR